MRKITQQAVAAFYEGKNFQSSNTSVEVNNGEVTIKLFGNTIAGTDYKGTWITHAGWGTRTTFERLNGLDDVSVYTRKGQTYLNDFPWDGLKTYIKTTEFFYD